ncbi:MAG: hypothetical protein HQL54_13280 [Magnetococcales bacterium]|nr:hypothetical protein [Magnetococcales bacterium]
MKPPFLKALAVLFLTGSFYVSWIAASQATDTWQTTPKSILGLMPVQVFSDDPTHLETLKSKIDNQLILSLSQHSFGLLDRGQIKEAIAALTMGMVSDDPLVQAKATSAAVQLVPAPLMGIMTVSLKWNDFGHASFKIFSTETGALVLTLSSSLTDETEINGIINQWGHQIASTITRVYPLQGKVIKVDGRGIRINLGELHGVTAGMAFNLLKKERDILFGNSGQKDTVDQVVGQIQIVQTGPEWARGQLVNKANRPIVGQRIAGVLSAAVQQAFFSTPYTMPSNQLADSEKRTIAIWPFDDTTMVGMGDTDDHGYLVRMLPDIIASTLQEAPNLRLIERSRFEDLLNEQNLAMSGLTEESDRLNLGKLLGSQLMVFGNFMAMGSMMQLSVRVVDVELGLAVFGANESSLIEGIEPVAQVIGTRMAGIMMGRPSHSDSLVITHSELWRRLDTAKQLLKLGQPEQGMASLMLLIEEHKNFKPAQQLLKKINTEKLYQSGLSAMKTGQLDQAIEIFSNLLQETTVDQTSSKKRLKECLLLKRQ